MRILGLDLSLRSTGYVLLDEDHVVWYGAIGSEVLHDAERLAMFDRWLRDELRDKRFGLAAVEGYSYGSPQGQTQAFSLGELGGIVKLALHQARIETHIIAPGTWKKVLCGNGAMSKRDATLELYKRYGIEFAKQDTLDAWAVAMTLRRQLLGLDKPEPKSRRRSKGLPLIPATEEAHDEEGAPARRRTVGAAPTQALEGTRGGLRPARA